MSDELDSKGRFLIYQTEKGDTRIDVYFAEETVWMTQKTLADLYQVTPQNITLHIKHIYEEGELDEAPTCKEFLQVQTEGERVVHRSTKYYNLDMILAIGYRVRGHVGNHFRRWASGVLTEYLKKGFALNDERLKNPKAFGADYFDELLERIREIRASEKRFYAKVKDIFALAVDYDGKSDAAQRFFQTIQNKLEYAATGHTAAEIITARADARKDNMGLTAFKGARVRKGDVTVAKNYMTRDEIDTLNRIVSMFLDYAEFQARNRHPMHMADWEAKVVDFLRFNDQEVLKNAGKVSREAAESKALAEYERYDANRRALEAADDVEKLAEQVKRLK